MTDSSTILGQFPVEEFLQDYWQRKHLFLKQALPSFRSPLAADELAGLACEEGVESRLVTHTNSSHRNPWRLSEGPFGETDFATLGESDWTLLVQDVDKFVPEVAQLLDLVGFLPRWSVDDIMISYATDGGSVGPHTDRYDVFLLQVDGTRRWEVSANIGAGALRDDTGLKVLAEFDGEETFLAQPGDVLYLPPGVAHYGVAQGACLTYSFGFRAPTENMIVGAFADALIEGASESQLRQTLTRPADHSARLEPGLIKAARKMVEQRLDEQAQGARFVGRYLTIPKQHLLPEPLEDAPTLAAFIQALDGGATLVRSPVSRFLFAESEGALTIFADGEDYDLEPAEAALDFVVGVCEGAPAEAFARVDGDMRERFGAVLLALLERGSLVLE